MQLTQQALTLSEDDGQTQEFVAMAFAPDSKYLVTVGSSPDCMLHFWMWEKSRGPIASFKCAPQVHCVCVCMCVCVCVCVCV
jgi:hypothetical protein